MYSPTLVTLLGNAAVLASDWLVLFCFALVGRWLGGLFVGVPSGSWAGGMPISWAGGMLMASLQLQAAGLL